MEKDPLGILLEDVNGKFDLLLEGFQGLRNEITRTREELCGKIDLNTAKIEFVREELISAKEELGEKIDQNTIRIKALDVKVETLDDKIDAVATEHEQFVPQISVVKAFKELIFNLPEQIRQKFAFGFGNHKSQPVFAG